MKAKRQVILYHGIPIVGRMPLFTADNRQAIRDNLKTQTRRLNGLEEINEDPWSWLFKGFDDDSAIFEITEFATRRIKVPWRIGDVRCMCEPLMLAPLDGVAYYRDDYMPVISLLTGKPLVWRWKLPWLSSIHMPTEAARTVRRTMDIRVEQLQEISEEDATAEGLEQMTRPESMGRATFYGSPQCGDRPPYWESDPRDAFMWLWDSIYDEKGFGWNVPQQVWALTFEQLKE